MSQRATNLRHYHIDPFRPGYPIKFRSGHWSFLQPACSHSVSQSQHSWLIRYYFCIAIVAATSLIHCTCQDTLSIVVPKALFTRNSTKGKNAAAFDENPFNPFPSPGTIQMMNTKRHTPDTNSYRDFLVVVNYARARHTPHVSTAVGVGIVGLKFRCCTCYLYPPWIYNEGAGRQQSDRDGKMVVARWLVAKCGLCVCVMYAGVSAR